jgi:hypothetical protein
MTPYWWELLPNYNVRTVVIPTTRGDGVVRLNIISGRDIIDSIIEITPTVFRRDRNPFESKCSLIP